MYEQLGASSLYHVSTVQLPLGQEWTTATIPEPKWNAEEDMNGWNTVCILCLSPTVLLTNLIPKTSPSDHLSDEQHTSIAWVLASLQLANARICNIF